VGEEIMTKRATEMRLRRKFLEKENAKRPDKLTLVARLDWPYDDDPSRIKVLISKKYAVQIFQEGQNVIRLSCNRTSLNQQNQFEDNLSWDELMEIKRQAGYGDQYAVEVYPEDRNIVNVANLRHL
jgi:hypothetical protein